jgi:hypothetical protein
MRRFFTGASIAVAVPAVALTIAASPALAATGQVALTAGAGQTQMAPLPDAAGCYVPDGANWRTVDCLTQAYIADHVRRPEVLDGIGGTTVNGNTAGRFTIGVISAKPLPNTPDVDLDTGTGQLDDYSLQDNAFFLGNNWNVDSVQFTQQIQDGNDSVCVWQVDVATQNYQNGTSCVQPSYDGSAPGGIVEGFSWDGLLGTVVQTLKGTIEGVVITADVYGLGSGDHWNNNSGSILGSGGGSEAFFSGGTEMEIDEQASSCQNEIGPLPLPVTCKPRPVQPLAYTGYSPGPMTQIGDDDWSTQETNDLTPVIGPPPADLPTVQYPNPYTAEISYVATPGGICSTGTPPSCE